MYVANLSHRMLLAQMISGSIYNVAISWSKFFIDINLSIWYVISLIKEIENQFQSFFG